MDNPLEDTLRESLAKNGFELFSECCYFTNPDGTKDRYLYFYNYETDAKHHFLESIMDKKIINSIS